MKESHKHTAIGSVIAAAIVIIGGLGTWQALDKPWPAKTEIRDLNVKMDGAISRLDRIELAAYEREIRAMVYKRCDAETPDQAQAIQSDIDRVLRDIGEAGLQTKMDMACR